MENSYLRTSVLNFCFQSCGLGTGTGKKGCGREQSQGQVRLNISDGERGRVIGLEFNTLILGQTSLSSRGKAAGLAKAEVTRTAQPGKQTHWKGSEKTGGSDEPSFGTRGGDMDIGICRDPEPVHTHPLKTFQANALVSAPALWLFKF